MGGNKENMKQAMKELLGLVGIGPEAEKERAETGEKERPAPRPAERTRSVQTPPQRPTAEEGKTRPTSAPERSAPAAPPRPAAEERSTYTAPAPERSAPAAPSRPAAEERSAYTAPAPERSAATMPPRPAADVRSTYSTPAPERSVQTPPRQSAVSRPPVYTPPQAPETRRTEGSGDLRGAEVKEEQREVAATMERGFFSGGFFGRRERAREQEREQARLREQERAREEERARAQALAQEREAARLMDDSLFPFGMPEEEPAPEPAGPAYNPNLTVVSAGTSLFGDIRSEGEVQIDGKLKGNLEATGSVRITGKVLGDVKGGSVELIGCAVQGNITAAALVRLDQGTIVVGDIIAADLETDGKIKGSVQVEHSAAFHPNAVLAGNVTASLVSMSQGAKIQGAVRISEDSETNALFGDKLEI